MVVRAPLARDKLTRAVRRARPEVLMSIKRCKFDDQGIGGTAIQMPWLSYRSFCLREPRFCYRHTDPQRAVRVCQM